MVQTAEERGEQIIPHPAPQAERQPRLTFQQRGSTQSLASFLAKAVLVLGLRVAMLFLLGEVWPQPTWIDRKSRINVDCEVGHREEIVVLPLSMVLSYTTEGRFSRPSAQMWQACKSTS